MSRPLFSLLFALAASPAVAAPASRPATQPVPQLQIVPQPYDQAAFTRDGVEVARYHFSKELARPFLYPLVGPSGRSLTRMGHPRDPVGHSHHNSVWVTHHDVNGVSFWGDGRKGVIVHQRIDAYEDEGGTGDLGGPVAAVRSTNHWVATAAAKPPTTQPGAAKPGDAKAAADTVLLVERRQTRIELLPDNELLLTIDLQFETPPKAAGDVTFGKTPFGLVGVRMAKTIGTHDGGGTIRSSEGNVNEKEVFWKTARWVDYSGPITNQAIEGVTLMDHPSNPNHPAGFHVRGDGWMAASLTLNEPLTIHPGKPLKLRYGLWVHNGMPAAGEVNAAWDRFAKAVPPADLAQKKK